MARTLQITDGTTTVDLVAASGFKPPPGGVQLPRLDGSHIALIDPVAGGRAFESYALYVKGSSHDNVATQVQTLVKLLRKAAQYQASGWQTTPVYLVAQASSETGARYALVYGCVELMTPGIFDSLFERWSFVRDFGFTIARESPWRSGVPGSPGSPITLGPSSGPVNPTVVRVANFDDDMPITHIYAYDASAAAFSANQVAATAIPLWVVSGSTPAAGDIHYFGGWGPFKNLVVPVGATAAVLPNVDLQLEYYNGASWVAVPAANHSIYPAHGFGAGSGMFSWGSQDYVINFAPPADWATVAINGQTLYWLRIRIASITTATTWPITGSTVCYAQNKNWIEIPAAASAGDMPPLLMLRLAGPNGGSTAMDFRLCSRILIGVKSRNLDAFQASMFLGASGQPSGWAYAAGTDGTSTTDVTAARGQHTNVTFATDSNLAVRGTLTGTNKLTKWFGTYKVIILAQQIGGGAGDTAVCLRANILAAASQYAKFSTPVVALKGHDQGWEAVDCGILKIPFGPDAAADSSNYDLILEIMALRYTGTSALRLGQLVLLPIDEAFITLDDPISQPTIPSSALKGAEYIELDGGLVRNRCVKKYGWLPGNNAYQIYETWNRDGRTPVLEPATKYRLYLLMLHFPTTYNTGPLVATPGMHLSAEMLLQKRYLALRGSA